MVSTTRLTSIPGLEDGAVIALESKGPAPVQTSEKPVSTTTTQPVQAATLTASQYQRSPQCSHGPHGKCLNCVPVGDQKPEEVKGKCLHGPNGRCLNCLDSDKPKDERKAEVKGKCLHGPNGKCLNCADSDKPAENPSGEKYLTKVEAKRCAHGANGRCLNCATTDIEGAKHLSFDEYVDRNFAKCRNHSKNQKCQNCLVDLAVEFKIKPNCKNHEPYPKGMCSQCIPPSINVRRQEYRHVDYAEFMNFQEISRFIKNWLETGFQRVGILYGYYAEDPVYEKGVRAIVEVLYEPPQDNMYNETVLLDDPAQVQLEQIVGNLGFERLGYVFTTFNKSAFLTNKEFMLAAKMQEAHGIHHPIGMRVSKQITLVLRGDLTSRPRQEQPGDARGLHDLRRRPGAGPRRDDRAAGQDHVGPGQEVPAHQTRRKVG